MISIIIPAYNVQEYIQTCLDSVLGQTFTDWEAWLIDDGATDETGVICDQYATKDVRFHVIHQKNAGLSAARNCGIEHASGEYLVFVDSDDFLHPQMLELLHIGMKGDPDAALGVCAFRKIYEGDDECTTAIDKPPIYETYTGREACKMLYEGNRVVEMTAAWNKIYRRELFETLRYPNGIIHEDEYIAYRLLYSCKKIIYVNEQLYNYRQRNGSIMYSSHYGREHMSLLEANEQAVLFYMSKNEPDLAAKATERAVGLGRMLYDNYENAREYKLQDEVQAFCNHIRREYKSIIKMNGYDRLILFAFCKNNQIAVLLEKIRQLFWKVVKGIKHAR